MRTYTYPAICERSGASFAAYFPDLPGCVTAADTVAELAEMAREALQLHLDGILEDGMPLPDATAVEALVHDPEVDEVGVIFVSATPGAGRTVTLALTDDLLQHADETAQRQGKTRERVLTEGLERLFAAE